MNRIRIELMHGLWQNAPTGAQATLHVKGKAYLGDRSLDVQSLVSQVQKINSPEGIRSFLANLNGFYAWLICTPNQIIATVDHIRSMPLFYACMNGHFYLSDDAEWARQQIHDQEMDLVAREEFCLTGYVTGADTIFPNIKQLQAGEYLVATQNGDKVKIETYRYYRYLHTEPENCDENLLYQQLDQAAVNSIQRLIDYANKRQIIVPLSGGYDSRLIVTLLKRLGHKNILTFTYGTKNNRESAYSKIVADTLGLQWHFVEYSEKLWKEAWATEKRWQYQKWASGWTSIAIVQDWLAVKTLKEKSIPEPDCIFVPGHTGDFISGGHIPEQAKPNVLASTSDLADAVFHKHYSIAPLHLFANRFQDFWSERILERADRPHVINGQSFANAFEKWEWQERQAKFICNSVRVYEFFGYDWWMPLWDTEFVRFWENVPLELRKEKHLYLRYVKTQYSGLTQGTHSAELGNATESGVLRNTLRRIVPKYLRALIFKLFVKKDAGPTNLAWRGRYPEKRYDLLLRSGYSMIGVVSFAMIESIDEFLKNNRLK